MSSAYPVGSVIFLRCSKRVLENLVLSQDRVLSPAAMMVAALFGIEALVLLTV